MIWNSKVSGVPVNNMASAAGCGTFAGNDTENIQDFIQKIELISMAYGIPAEEFVRVAIVNLRGEAQSWAAAR